MAEVVIYHHLYNKKFGTCYIDSGPVVADLPVQSEVRYAAVTSKYKVASTFSGISKFLAFMGIALLITAYVNPVLAWSKSIIESNIGSYKPSKTEIILSSAPQTRKPTSRLLIQVYLKKTAL